MADCDSFGVDEEAEDDSGGCRGEALPSGAADAEEAAASFRWGTTGAAGVEAEDNGEARREPANALLVASSSCNRSNRRNRRRPSSVEGEAADAGAEEGAVAGGVIAGCDTDAEEETDATADARASLEGVSLTVFPLVATVVPLPLLALGGLFGGSAPRAGEGVRRRGRGGSPSDGDEGEEGDEDVAMTTPILLLPLPFDEIIAVLRPLVGVRCSAASGDAVVDRWPAANAVVTECPSSAPFPPQEATGELLLPPTFRRSPAASEETEPSLRSSLTFIGVGGAVAASIRTLPSKVPPPVFIAAVGRCCGASALEVAVSKGAKVSGAAEDGALMATSAGTLAALSAVLCLLLLPMPVVAPPACVAWRSSPSSFVFAALSVRRANGF